MSTCEHWGALVNTCELEVDTDEHFRITVAHCTKSSLLCQFRRAVTHGAVCVAMFPRSHHDSDEEENASARKGPLFQRVPSGDRYAAANFPEPASTTA